MKLIPPALLQIALALIVTAAWAQETEVPFGNLQNDPSQAIELSSDSLSIDQADGSAIFEGNVVIGQGDLRITAGKVRIEYAAEGQAGASGIARIVASGGVTMVNGDEAAEGASAEYSLADGIIILEGAVILTQGQNAISAERMIYDLNTGVARLEGRVRTILQSSDN